jgi:hypothetical protein
MPQDRTGGPRTGDRHEDRADGFLVAVARHKGDNAAMPRRTANDRVKLLHGPYRAPRLHVGDRALCLFRDCLVVVTSWTDAPISWPRALPVGERGHPSILVDDELARAVRLESAAAVRFWWGVSGLVIWKWRKALGVGRMDNPGSRRLMLAASAKGAAAVRGVPLPPEQVEQRRRTALEKNLAQYLPKGYHGPCWAPCPMKRWRGGSGGRATPCGSSGRSWASQTPRTGGGDEGV